LIARLDRRRGSLKRSYIVKISVAAFLDEVERVENLQARERLLEASK
jgi:hypothetical protein